jgi:hypothetical protein
LSNHPKSESNIWRGFRRRDGNLKIGVSSEEVPAHSGPTIRAIDAGSVSDLPHKMHSLPRSSARAVIGAIGMASRHDVMAGLPGASAPQ